MAPQMTFTRHIFAFLLSAPLSIILRADPATDAKIFANVESGNQTSKPSCKILTYVPLIIEV